MPKDLPNKPCRSDTKKQSVVAKSCKNSLIKATKVLSSKIAKKKNDTKKKLKKILQNDGGTEKLKERKKPNIVVPIKTRSGACLLDSNASKTNAPKMKDKQKPAAEKPKPKDDKGKAKKEPAKKSTTVLNNAAVTTTPTSTTTKKEPKKVKNDKEGEPVAKKVSKSVAKKDAETVDKKEPPKIDKLDDTEGTTTSVAKKDTKKDKEPAKKTPKSKKEAEKKDASKQDKNDDKNTTKKDIEEPIKKEPATKKDSKSKDDTVKISEKEPKAAKSEPAKKRPPKKAKDTHSNETAKKDTDDKITAPLLNESADKKEPPSQSNKIKFFKSKSKKAEKAKEPVTKKSNDLKDAFSVYDNIDEDSEGTHNKTIAKKKEPSKVKVSKIGKETELKMKQHLEEFKKTKLKAKDTSNKDDKRKLDSDSEIDNKVRKKAKKNVGGDDDDDHEPSTAPPQPASKSKSNKKIKPKEEELSSPSSDSIPLNRLVTKTPAKKDPKSKATASSAVKREPHSDDSEIETKKKPKTETTSKKAPKKSPAKPTPSKKAPAEKKSEKTPKKSTPKKKVVRFEKQATPKAPPKMVRKRKQRMASLNAMAMVHCLYDNDSKSASVSSYDSTEFSDDNMIVEPVETKRKKEPSPVPEVKVETKDTAVVKYEKEQFLVQDPSDPMINRESLRTAPGLRSIGKHWDMNSSSISSTLSDENLEMIASPIVIKEITASLEKPKNALKKKFARALRRQISEESSEEEKHQALLLEEKKRMVRRRRRQRKEITMDLKDMVVCKRMASLNATAILAASYSSLTGKRTITVKSSGKAEEKRENVENFEKTESVIAKIKSRKLPFIRKKFSSSSDADVEDEADLSGGEVVVKSASSSGKQQVSLIVNQDSGVTITGVYLNSTTKSTHHQGYCSISGMQYRISSTSHTQTEATTVTTEPIVRNPQEPLRPPVSVFCSFH